MVLKFSPAALLVLFCLLLPKRIEAVETGEFQHHCIHDDVSKTVPQAMGVQRYSERRRAIESIRIFPNVAYIQPDADPYACYPSDAGGSVTTLSGPVTCSSDNILTAGKALHLTELLREARTRLESLLRVDRVNGPLVLPSSLTSCYSAGLDLPVPAAYRNPGLSGYDLVLFIAARPILSTSTLAFASECASDQNFRPIAGFVNFNPTKLRSISTPSEAQDHWDWEKEVGTAMHEITHVLGFSAGKLNQYRDPNNSSRADNPLDVRTVSGRTVSYITSPSVVRAVQNHFQCPTLPGAEIEDGGSSGTAGSHWEKRIFNGEYMIGTSSRDAAVSPLTLALLNDSGWYYPDFSKAEHLFWGFGEGCEFASPAAGACSPSSAAWSSYSCDTDGATACAPDRLGKAGCSIKTYTSPLPSYYQHLDTNLKGGADDLLDYCPTYKTFSNGWCTDTSNSPSGGAGFIDQAERFCEDCRCFSSSLAVLLPAGAGAFADTCYQTYCSSSGNDGLKILLDSVWYPCDVGTTLSIDQWGGELTCPTDNSLCRGAVEDTAWPTFVSIEPSSGGPGTKLTISGTNFHEGMEVKIEQSCDDVEVESSTVLKCVLPKASEWTKPQYLVAQNYDVILTTTTGGVKRHAVGLDEFNFALGLPTDEFIAMVEYFSENPGIAALVAVLTLLFCVGCCWFCAHERQKALKGEQEQDYNWD